MFILAISTLVDSSFFGTSKNLKLNSEYNILHKWKVVEIKKKLTLNPKYFLRASEVKMLTKFIKITKVYNNFYIFYFK